ncbi:MAG: YpdA family putative bacillithiol disulfide reductase [Acidobacteria bacterium]|nr:YpdA family putative bacillithiol disulfide reductase [Acidobacteriota bacterium]
MNDLDLLIIGGGPTGLACAIEASRAGLCYLVIEKGCLANSLYHYPTQLTFFTTPELLEIGELPFVCERDKPNRIEALKYYRRVAETCQLKIRQYERVTRLDGADGDFTIHTATVPAGIESTYRCRKVIIATGYYDLPNMMGIPGEHLPQVAHYYRDAHPYYDRDVAIIGAGNSAALAGLDLWRHGARVTIIHRGAGMRETIKYWILPDIENRIRNGEISGFFRHEVVRIEPGSIQIRSLEDNLERRLPTDFVFALTGYHADHDFLAAAGIKIDPESMKPAINPETFETNVAGIYLAGVVMAGRDTGKIFIENGRFHGIKILADLAPKISRS